MAWDTEITLIKETEAADGDGSRTNKNGFPLPKEESSRTVFCNELSVGFSEYFKSEQAGKTVEGKYEIHMADYEGEDTAEINGQRYFILKTYKPKGKKDIIELTLTDLRHKEAKE